MEEMAVDRGIPMGKSSMMRTACLTKSAGRAREAYRLGEIGEGDYAKLFGKTEGLQEAVLTSFIPGIHRPPVVAGRLGHRAVNQRHVVAQRQIVYRKA